MPSSTAKDATTAQHEINLSDFGHRVISRLTPSERAAILAMCENAQDLLNTPDV